MPYRFLIIDPYYPKFLHSLYRRKEGLAKSTFERQRQVILDEAFGTSNFYSRNLNLLGHAAQEIIPNALPLQLKWAEENHCCFLSRTIFAICKRAPILNRFMNKQLALELVKQQVKRIQPDILYVQEVSFFPPDVLFDMKKYVKLLVGQNSCPRPHLKYYAPYDLILTSFPHYVDFFRGHHIPAEFFKIAFDPSVLKKNPPMTREYDCTFIGGFSPLHIQGTKDLEHIASKQKLTVFGYGKEFLPPHSPLLKDHRGEAWGLDMYRALLKSKITLNRHGEVAENYANNMRLYEATGCGALLITDAKDNLNDLFEVGKEVVAYRTADELVDLIGYYLSHDQERESIARAGQARTLKDHTYFHRMQELIPIVEEYGSQKVIPK